MTSGVLQCRPASESSRVKLGAASNIRLGHRPSLAAQGRSGVVHSFGGMQCRPTSGSGRVGLGAAFSIRPGVIRGCFLGCRASCVRVGVVGRELVPPSALGGHPCGAVPSNLRTGRFGLGAASNISPGSGRGAGVHQAWGAGSQRWRSTPSVGCSSSMNTSGAAVCSSLLQCA